MATYKGIKGFSIQNLSADPTDLLEGQMWYNSTSNVWKVEETTTAGAFASGPSMSTARRVLASTNSSPTSSVLGVTGYIGPTISNATEEYNGTSWSNGTNTPTTTYGSAVAGTESAAIFGLGDVDATPTGATANSFKYDGSTWTSANPLNTARFNTNAGFGIQTAAVFAGGGPTGQTATEEYDGTSWVNGNPMNVSRVYPAGIGTQTAGLIAAGPAAPATNTAEEYDGTSWAAASTLPGSRGEQPSLFGIQTSAILAGGNAGLPTYLNTSISYDGTTWSSNPATLTTGRGYGGGAGATSASGLVFAGYTGPANLNSTEIYTGPGALVTKTITTS